MTSFLRYLRRHHIALLALFFALAGTSFAAANALLPKNSVGSAQVRNGSLQRLDLSKKAVSSLRGNRGLRGLKGDKGDQGIQGIQGVQGTQGVPGQIRAFARVRSDGTLETEAAGQQQGVLQANIQHSEATPEAEVTGPGVYCFGGLGFTPVSAVVALDNSDSMPAVPALTGGTLNHIATVSVFKGPDLGRCDPAHGQVRVAIEQVNDSALPTLASHGFFIWFE